MTIALGKPRDEIIVQEIMSWTKFKKLQDAFSDLPGYRLSYYEGEVEILSVSLEHGRIAEHLTYLLNTWLLEQSVDYSIGGDSTIQRDGVASAQGDKSYWFNSRDPDIDPTPDLSIEIVISGEGTTKLKRYRALGVPEVWFWKNNKIHMYNPLQSVEHEIHESQFMKGINLPLLAECSTTKKLAEAIKCFRSGGQV